MLGYGMGVCGLSFADFCMLTPREFEAVCDAVNEHDDGEQRAAWERARIIGALSVSPWSKGNVELRKVLPLPWDSKPSVPAPAAHKIASKEEEERAFERLMKRRATYSQKTTRNERDGNP